METTELLTEKSSLDSPPPTEGDMEEKKRRSAARRERIMQQMKTAQNSFANQNVGDLKEIALPEESSLVKLTSLHEE